MKQEDVQALSDNLFNVNVKRVAKASQHRVYYNIFGQILALSPKEIADYKEESFIRVSRDRYVELADTNLKSWMVDTSQEPPQLINISTDAMSSTNRVHITNEYNPKRLFKFDYNLKTRKLKLVSIGYLSGKLTIWITPKGQYSIMLERIYLHSLGEFEYDIKPYLDTKEISLVSRYNLDMLVSYRTSND